MLIWIVMSSIFWTSLMAWMALPTSVLARMRSKWSIMASASKGVPSWKVMPSRATKVHWSKVALGSKDSSRNGWASRSSPT